MTSLIGQTLLHYRVTALLGAGGMGEVYLAEDTKLDRMVALKVVPSEFAASPRRLARFEREAKAVAALNHPNIVTIHSIEEDRGIHFLTMEFVEGETLDQILSKGGLSPERIAAYGVPLAEALAAAHERGIIHRDLKPGNVMVTSDGRVKVLDFGLAKLLDETDGSGSDLAVSQMQTDTLTLTAAGVVVGTVPYLSPEYLDGHVADHRSDIFSLGVVLYEMTTGLLPFRGNSGPAMMSSILRDTPRPIAEIRPEVPLHLVRLIERCLEKEPTARYQSASDVAYELQTVSEASGWRARRLAPSRLQLWPWRRIGLVAAIVACIGLLAFWWKGREPEPEPSEAVSSVEAFDASDWVIAVIPSATIAAQDPDVEAINEGLASTLTTKLAQLSQGHALQIIPAITLREEKIDSLEKARSELGVTLALNFDTRRLGDKIRVNTQLVDIPNKRQLMAETIDGSAEDLLTLEELVTANVLRLLRVELRPMEETMLAAGTRDARAYNYYLRAQGYLQNYLDLSSIEAAAGLFEEALGIDPEFASARAGLGQAYWQQYRQTSDMRFVDAAFEQCRRAVDLDDLEPEGHQCLGTLLNGTGRYEEAIDELRVAKSLDPTSDLVLRGLADAYVAEGRLELAEETYKEAVSLRPHYWSAHNWLGIFYHRRGRTEEAIASFREVIRLAPDSYVGFSNLGGSLYFEGRFEEAEEAFLKALEIKQDEMVLANLGTLYFFQQRYPEAIEIFEQAVEVNGRDGFNWGQLADAYYWSGEQSDQAEAAFRRAVSLSEEQLVINPRDAILLADLAYYRAMLGEDGRARTAIERALAEQPSDVDIQHRAAQVYLTVGDRSKALRFVRQAVANGYPGEEIAIDPHFADWASDPEFRRALALPND